MRRGLGGGDNRGFLRRGSLRYDAKHLRRARRLRSEMSVSEKWLWSQIRRDQLGFRFKRQVPVDEYVLDFYCPEASLAIEVDGEQHAHRMEKDLQRDARLSELGIETLRLPSLDLFDASRPDCGFWPERIKRKCEERTGRLAFEFDRMMQAKGLSPSPAPPSFSAGAKNKGGASEPSRVQI